MSARTDGPLSGKTPRSHARRTRILSRPADQLRTSLVPTLGAAVLLVLLLAAVHQVNDGATRELAESNPGFRNVLEAQALAMESTLATGAVFYLFGVLAIGLIHSRRLVGALFSIHRRIRMMAEGDLTASFHLRRKDYFHDVAESINESVCAFRLRAQEDLADVNDLLLVLDRSPYTGPVRDGLRETLKGIQDRKRTLLGMESEQDGAPAERQVVAFPG
jgi:hypothetical protein